MTCNGRWISKRDPRTGKIKRICVKNPPRGLPPPNSNLATRLESLRAKVNDILKKSLETFGKILPLMPGIIGKLGHLLHLADDKLKESKIREVLRSIQEQLDAVQSSIEKTNRSESTKHTTKLFIKNVRNVFDYSTDNVQHYVNQFFLIGLESSANPRDMEHIRRSSYLWNNNTPRDIKSEIKSRMENIANCLLEQFEAEFGKNQKGTITPSVIPEIIKGIVDRCLEKVNDVDNSIPKLFG